MCAHVYISRRFLQLLNPLCGHMVDVTATRAWSGSAVHPLGKV